MLELETRTTALILIDLQKGILGRSLAPYSGAQVFERVMELAGRFCTAKSPVVRVRVDFGPGGSYAHSQKIDAAQPGGPLPADFADFPYQAGSSLNASGIGYGMLRQQDALKRLKDLEGMRPR